MSYIAPRLDEASRTVPVRVEVKPGPLTVLPGMFAEAEVFAPAATAAVLGILLNGVFLVFKPPMAETEVLDEAAAAAD